MAAQDADSGSETFLLLLLVAAGIYFLPTIIANKRNAPDLGSVIVINTFFGWTFLGWVVSLSMAFRSRPEPLVIQTQTIVVEPTEGAQAGWYPDPAGSGNERFWNGISWSAATRQLERGVN